MPYLTCTREEVMEAERLLQAVKRNVEDINDAENIDYAIGILDDVISAIENDDCDWD